MNMDKHVNKFGGVAAITQLLAYIVGIAILVGIWIPAGFDPENTDALKNLQFFSDNYNATFALNVGVYVISSIFQVILAIAIYHKFKDRCPIFNQATAVIGLIWAGVLMAAAMISAIALNVGVDLLETNQDQAIVFWTTIRAVSEGLGGGTEFVGGLWVLMVSIIGIKTDVFGKAINYLGFALGLVGVLSILPNMGDLISAFAMGILLWFLLLGIDMYKGYKNSK